MGYRGRRVVVMLSEVGEDDWVLKLKLNVVVT